MIILRYLKVAVVVLLTAAALFKVAPHIIPTDMLLADIGFSTAVYGKNGKLLRLTLADDSSYRAFVSLNNISPKLKDATLLYEDRWFYYHFGMNPVSLLRGAFSYFSSDKRPLGGSTITMQLARIKYGINSKTISGKIEQIFKAFYLELVYTKDEIFEAYLNLAPYGHNIAGVEAASLIYFGSASSSLSLIESLSLAVIPQNPSGRTPTKLVGMERLTEARGRLFEMWTVPHPEDKKSASLFNLSIDVNTPTELPYIAPHFTDMLLLSGLKGNINTTIDIAYQRVVEKRIEAFMRRNKSKGVKNAAAVLVNYKTMEIAAYVGSSDYFNETISGQVDGVMARRSPGSVLKPFIYGLAVEQGIIHPKSMLKDSPRRFGAYSPENADRGFMGPLFASDALVHSRNIPAIDLLNKLGKPSFYDLLKNVGIKDLQKKDYYGSALALGGFEVSMLEVAELYSGLANFGTIKNIKTVQNTESIEKINILTKEASFLTLEMLSTNPKPYGVGDLGVVYWKTGTSFAFRDAWSAGIFGDYVLVVWVGNFDGSGNQIFTGRGVAAPLFFNIISGIKNLEKTEFERIMPSLNMNVKLVDICSPTGDLPDKFCPQIEQGWFIPGVSPVTVSEVYRQIPVDKKTGLRACKYDKETTYLDVYEFWPTDISDLFRKSGIHKKLPPKYMAGCDIDDISYTGTMPIISMPAENSVYTFSVNNEREDRIPFFVSTDSGAAKIYWFLNGKFIGDSRPSEYFFWKAVPGSYELTATDDAGRSGSTNFKVEFSGL